MSESPSSHVSCTSSASRNRVNFTSVQVFYFNRRQGFSCVPTRGGSSLGMVAKHWGSEEFDLDEHENIRRYERYHLLMKKYRTGKLQLSPAQVKKIDESVRGAPKWLSTRLRLKPFGECASTTNDSTSDLLLDSHAVDSPNGVASLLCETTENDVESSDSHSAGNDNDDELSSILDCYLLQLLSVKKRRLLLAKSGLKHIDPTERAECQAIRESREVCGCSCPNGICLPAYCQCSLNGVPCQIDHTDFPCSCSHPTQCVNPVGRTEFNPLRVRAHYIHTHMQLETGSSPADFREETCTYGGIKRPRFEDSQLFEDSPTDVAYKYNSTLTGGCSLCQNDQFVHLLTRNLVFTSPLLPAATSPSIMLSSSTEFKTDEASVSFTDSFVSTSTITSPPSTLHEFPGHSLDHYQSDQSICPPLFPEVDGSGMNAYSDATQIPQSSANRVVTTAYPNTLTANENPSDTFIPFNYATPMDHSTNDSTVPPARVGEADAPASHQLHGVVGPLAPITSLLPKMSSTAGKDEDPQPWSYYAYSPADDQLTDNGPGDTGQPKLPATDSPTHIESQYTCVAEEVPV